MRIERDEISRNLSEEFEMKISDLQITIEDLQRELEEGAGFKEGALLKDKAQREKIQQLEEELEKLKGEMEFTQNKLTLKTRDLENLTVIAEQAQDDAKTMKKTMDDLVAEAAGETER